MIYENITRADYNKLEGVNASKLKSYYESSLNGNYENSKPRVESEAMAFGTAAHSMVLENEKFKIDYAIFEAPINPKTGEAYGASTNKCKEAKALLPDDKIYLSDTQMDTLTRISINLNGNSKAMQILKACPKRETALTWIDDESGEKCKALIDFMGNAIAGDFKTTREIRYKSDESATSKALKWEMVGNKNLLQFAFYFDGLIANDIDVKKFAVIFAKNNGNCDVLPAFLSPETFDFGREMYNKAMLNYTNRADNRSAYELITV